jgi:hypothetical protein
LAQAHSQARFQLDSALGDCLSDTNRIISLERPEPGEESNGIFVAPEIPPGGPLELLTVRNEERIESPSNDGVPILKFMMLEHLLNDGVVDDLKKAVESENLDVLDRGDDLPGLESLDSDQVDGNHINPVRQIETLNDPGCVLTASKHKKPFDWQAEVINLVKDFKTPILKFEVIQQGIMSPRGRDAPVVSGAYGTRG